MSFGPPSSRLDPASSGRPWACDAAPGGPQANTTPQKAELGQEAHSEAVARKVMTAASR